MPVCLSRQGRGEVDVDLGIDWRSREPVALEVGPVLAIEDAVGNKVAALYSRGEVRDYLDVDHITVSVIAAKLAVSWHAANEAILAEGHRVLIDDPARFDGVHVIGADEHVWRHTRRSD